MLQPDKPRRTGATQRGISLVELLVVIALMSAILLIATPWLLGIFQQYRLETASRQMAIQISFARNAAVKQKIDYRITVRNETDGTKPNSYFFENDSDNDGLFEPYEKLDVTLPSGVVIKSGSLSQLTFDSRGRSSGSGFIRLQGQDSTQYEVRVSLNGGVQTVKL